MFLVSTSIPKTKERWETRSRWFTWKTIRDTIGLVFTNCISVRIRSRIHSPQFSFAHEWGRKDFPRQAQLRPKVLESRMHTYSKITSTQVGMNNIFESRREGVVTQLSCTARTFGFEHLSQLHQRRDKILPLFLTQILCESSLTLPLTKRGWTNKVNPRAPR